VLKITTSNSFSCPAERARRKAERQAREGRFGELLLYFKCAYLGNEMFIFLNYPQSTKRLLITVL